MKVLHVVYQSIPDICGSTIRSKNIVSSQRSLGLEPIVVSSPFQDIQTLDSDFEVIEGIKYYRNSNIFKLRVQEGGGNIVQKILKALCIVPFAYRVYRIAKKENVDIIHCHATFFSAFGGYFAAKMLKKKWIYEVRSLWDERQKTTSKRRFKKISVQMVKAIETKVMNLSDELVAINSSLKNALVERGVSTKINIVMNAAPKRDFSLLTPIQEKTNDSRLVFAYVGTLTEIEGLELLLTAFETISEERALLRIYGRGPKQEVLQERLNKMKKSNIFLMGGFDHTQVYEIYSSVDCIINPRIKIKLTDTVTPLKPLEALSFKKLFLGSDVGGIKELIKDKKTGLLFEADNIQDLQSKISFILNTYHSIEIKRIIDAGYKDVIARFSWETNAKLYKDIYERQLYTK